MNQSPVAPESTREGHTSHRFFARYYERTSRSADEEAFMNPLRKEVTSLARGRVLEVGAGNGLNFAFYDPNISERVDAIEPDSAMLEYARERAAAARVPINLVQTPVERLPFADETFESAVVTLVFCSVNDPLRGLSEIRRVLKPGGMLLMVEHVRARGIVASTIQTLATPVTRLLLGNCHWNRDTGKTVVEAGFQIEQKRDFTWSMMPFMVLHAVK